MNKHFKGWLALTGVAAGCLFTALGAVYYGTICADT